MKALDRDHAQIVALNEIYTTHKRFMLSIAKTFVSDAHACEDIFHNAFISIIRNKEKVITLPPPQLKAYLLLAVRHASIDYLRKERRMNIVEIPNDILFDLISKSEEILSLSDMPFQTVEFYSVIRKLPAEDQSLLIGKYVIGLDTNELAQLLNCKQSTLRVKLHRANRRAYELFTSLGLSYGDFL